MQWARLTWHEERVSRGEKGRCWKPLGGGGSPWGESIIQFMFSSKNVTGCDVDYNPQGGKVEAGPCEQG